MATQPIPTEDEASEPEDGIVTGSLRVLADIAQQRGDISHLLDDQTLATLGANVVEDYERDIGARKEWEDTVNEALKRAAQEKIELENPPPYRKSAVNFPILTVAAQQFNARAYPAICKSGNMVRVQVIGSDKGRPKLDANGQPMVQINGQAVTQQQAAAMIAQASAAAPQPAAQPGMNGTPPIGHNGGPPLDPQPAWDIAPGAKQKRADRVADYLNVYVEFRMDDWEEDTDLLLYQLAIIGCGFRKLWWADGKQCAAYVSALDLIVPVHARSLDTTPRITERMPDVYPYQISQRMASGEYRQLVLTPDNDDDQAPRLLLEQHRLEDLDGDGLEEPYIVTVDKETMQVLKIEANFSPDDIALSDDGRVTKITKQRFYIKYGFLPNPKGHFYDIGFGHLLAQMGDIINTTINQMMDAGHAQIAGGGWIAAGLRLQGNNRNETMRWMPGEYKTVNAQAGDLRAGIVERTFPDVSPIMFQLLEMMLGAAKDITSVKDVVTGDAPNTAPVGTTMALIEQGLQVFTAIYKRVYRSLGKEFRLIYDNLVLYGGDEAAQDYANVLDDPAADFQKDFSEKDMDIKPVADPSSVTKMQQVAKAQFLASMKGQGLNDIEIDRRMLEAAGIEDIDSILPPENAPPNPAVMADLAVKASQVRLNDAHAASLSATATKTAVDVGHQLGESEGAGDTGRVPAMGGPPGNAMGVPGPGGAGDGAAGPLGAGIVGPGGV